jgi:hypothetical protein
MITTRSPSRRARDPRRWRELDLARTCLQLPPSNKAPLCGALAGKP